MSDTVWSKFINELVMQAKLKEVPISGQFELTARCNNSCKMCYVCKSTSDREAKNKEYSAKEWIKLAEEARDAGMLYLLLTGGEVFLRQDFMEIYNELSMMGIKIGIYTNATLITSEIAKQLGRTPPSRVEVTLYGSSSDIYRKVSGNPNGFNDALNGIDLMLAEGIAIELKTTVIHDTANDFDKIAELADKRNLLLKIVDYIAPRRDGNTHLHDNLRLSPIELLEYEKHVREYYVQRKRKLQDDQFPIIDFKEDRISTNVDNYPFKCSAGRSEFWVTWDGKMTPCGLIDEPATLPFKDGFAAAWKGLKDTCVSIPLCTECSDCSLNAICLSCPARLKVETGFFDRPAPYLCEFAKKTRCSIP